MNLLYHSAPYWHSGVQSWAQECTNVKPLKKVG